jgi:hypothetical protein
MILSLRDPSTHASANGGEGVEDAVNDHLRVGVHVYDLAVDLEGSGLGRSELVVADPRLLSQSHGRRSQDHQGDTPSTAVRARHDLEQSVIWPP